MSDRLFAQVFGEGPHAKSWAHILQKRKSSRLAGAHQLSFGGYEPSKDIVVARTGSHRGKSDMTGQSWYRSSSLNRVQALKSGAHLSRLGLPQHHSP